MENEHTVFIIDEDLKICKDLQYLFESVNLKVETYDSTRKFLLNYHSGRQGCLILNSRMSDISCIELLNKLNPDKHSLPAIVISDDSEIPTVVKVMQAGAIDFIPKPIDNKYLLEIVHYYLEKSAKMNPFSFLPSPNALTKREQEVMNLILDGKFNKEIAHDLEISISTVEAHRSRIMDKFHAKNLAQLIKNYFHIPDYYYK